MTQGMKSSEFLVALVPVLLGFALVLIGAFKGPPDLISQGTWLLLGGSGAYATSRGLAKLGSSGGQTPAAPESTPVVPEATKP